MSALTRERVEQLRDEYLSGATASASLPRDAEETLSDVAAALTRLLALEDALKEAGEIAAECRHEAQFYDADGRNALDHAAALLERLAALGGDT